MCENKHGLNTIAVAEPVSKIRGMIDAHAHCNAMNTLPLSLVYVQDGKNLTVGEIIEGGIFENRLISEENGPDITVSTIKMSCSLVESNTFMYLYGNPVDIYYRKLFQLVRAINALTEKYKDNPPRIVGHDLNGNAIWKGDNWDDKDSETYTNMKNDEMNVKKEMMRKDVPSLIIVATMDTEFAHLGGYERERIKLEGNAGSHLERWKQLIKDTETTVKDNPLRLFPLLSYDPRRYRYIDKQFREPMINGCGRWNDPFAYIVGHNHTVSGINDASRIWFGFEMNPLLGFRPFDELCEHLPEFYKECEGKEIPILAHCAPEGFITPDAAQYEGYDKKDETLKKRVENGKCWHNSQEWQHNIKEPYISDNIQKVIPISNNFLGIQDIIGNNKKMNHFYKNYGHPKNWECVLRCFPKLHLCLANFGGNSEWKHEIMAKWAKNMFLRRQPFDYKKALLPPRKWISSIIRLTCKYSDVYTDISGLNIYDDEIRIGLLKMLYLIKNDNDYLKHLKYKLIFGSDWYFSSLIGVMKRYDTYCNDFKDIVCEVDYELWEYISFINPWRCYSLSEDKIIKIYESLPKPNQTKAMEGLRDKLIELNTYVLKKKSWTGTVPTLYELGDDGNVVLEINIRLAGFGGLLPTDKFTELTEKGVKQFQRDYMGLSGDNITGVVDYDTLVKIDEFSNKYGFDFNQTKCPCSRGEVHTVIPGYSLCDGFGNGRKNVYIKQGIEYPGMHRSLLFILKALLFYFEYTESSYSLEKIDSGYRCYTDNERQSRKTTNHMGLALDLHFNKNGERTYSSEDMDIIRRNFFCEYMGAPISDGVQRYNFGWKKNQIGLEPRRFKDDKTGATSWVHVDIREFDELPYKNSVFFVKNETDIIGKSILELKNE